MKKKQLLSLALTAALTMSMLAGCGSNAAAPAADSSSAAGTETTAAAEPVADESGYVYTGEAPITQEEGQSLKILAETSNYSNVDIASARIVTTVVEQAGISVDWQLLDFNSYAEAATPMLTSGNVDADIVLLPDQDDNQVYIKSGLFEPLDAHFGSMPNFTAWLDANPELKAQLTAEDGHIYYVPGINVAHDYQPCLMYNQVWLKKAGMEAPENLDDFVTLLRYFRDNDMNDNGDPSDEIPMSIMGAFLPYMFGPAFGLDLVSGFQADDKGNVTYAYADSENYKKYLSFLNDLYTEGLLEVEYTSLDRDQVIARISNDLTGVAFDYSWAMSMMYSNVLPYYDGTAETAFLGAKPLSGEHEGFYVGRNFLSNMFGVNSSSANIDLACKFLDYAMSDPCQELYQWGILGESYVINDDGTRSFTEQGQDNDWLQQLGINPSFVYPARQSVEATDILVADWHAASNADLRQYVVSPWPFIYATAEESEVVNTYMTDIQTLVDESATAFITGNRSLDEFDSYIEELNAINLSEVLTVKQAQYTRYYNALN